MVGEEGLEPSHPGGHQILSLARLPIPPLARAVIASRFSFYLHKTFIRERFHCTIEIRF